MAACFMSVELTRILQVDSSLLLNLGLQVRAVIMLPATPKASAQLFVSSLSKSHERPARFRAGLSFINLVKLIVPAWSVILIPPATYLIFRYETNEGFDTGFWYPICMAS